MPPHPPLPAEARPGGIPLVLQQREGKPGSFQIFERILYIWAIRHPACGYVQGINDLVTPFFVVFLSDTLSDGDFTDLSLRPLT